MPAPTSLQFNLPCSTTLGLPAIGLSDTTGLTAGMQVSGNGIATNTTLSSVGSTSAVLSSNVLSTQSSAILSFWNDSTLLEGISGWEEYVVIDSAIKAQIKQEGDVAPLLQQKADMKARIEAMAEARDQGQAFHVSDVMGAASFGGMGNDTGFGGDF